MRKQRGSEVTRDPRVGIQIADKRETTGPDISAFSMAAVCRVSTGSAHHQYQLATQVTTFAHGVCCRCL